MSDDLGGPRRGVCHVRRFVVVSEKDGEVVTRGAEADLGLMSWAELIDMVADQGGHRPTYDLFDVPQPDGTVLRYRAVDARLIP